VSVRAVCDGLCAQLEVTGQIGHSAFTQHICLTAQSTRLEFRTEVDWQELHRLLKVSFPVNVRSENALHEMQFGYVARPTHRSRAYDKDRFEVCNHRYTALCNGGHGAALLNDCKYGISVNDNAMELTLLRAAASPEMRADNRVHTFTYAFTAWDGPFEACDVVQQGYDLNVPARVIPGKAPAFSLVDIDRDNVILDTVKPAEDGSGDIILRFYEAKRAACTARIRLSLPVQSISLCDILEQPQTAVAMENNYLQLDFDPFRIHTLRCRLA